MKPGARAQAIPDERMRRPTESADMTSTDLRPATDAAAAVAPAGPAGVDALMRTRRASLVFVAIVFASTLVQVLVQAVPAAAAGDAWQNALPAPVVLTAIVVGCAAQAAALLCSARRPGLAVMLTLLIYLALVFVTQAPAWLWPSMLVVPVALFLLGGVRRVRIALVWLVVTSTLYCAGMVSWALTLGIDPGLVTAFILGQSVEFVGVATGATALGVWWGDLSHRASAAWRSAQDASREHDLRVARARELERDRIAQELHDVAGQHLAGLLTLTDGVLSLATARPHDALEMVAEVRAEGKFAAASLYGAIADLAATGTAPAGSTRDLRQVEDLVAFWRRRGARIELTTAGDLGDVPAVVSTTGFRCVQEALTNAAKHAPGAEIRIEVDAAPEHLSIVIENEPAPAQAKSAAGGTGLGWGLAGLRERVSLVNGTLVATHSEAGGFHVGMNIPLVDFRHPPRVEAR